MLEQSFADEVKRPAIAAGSTENISETIRRVTDLFLHPPTAPFQRRQIELFGGDVLER
jgi:hypothetical protein